MTIERTTFNGIRVGPYTYPAVRRQDGLYVKTMRKPSPALRFLLDAIGGGDIDVMFDGETIPFKRVDEPELRHPWRQVIGALATDHERFLLSLFDANIFADE